MPTTKARGRPKHNVKNQQCQQNILDVARNLFMEMEYENVTMRKIADSANVDIALIRYYFGKKEQLYKAVFDDIYKPFFQKMNQIGRTSSSQATIEELFMAIYHLNINNPNLLGIIYKTLVLNVGPKKRYINQSILTYIDDLHIKIFSSLQQKGIVKKDLDVHLLKDSFNALVMLPFFFYPLTSAKSTEQETIAHCKKLYQQNVRLFLYGCTES